MGPKECIYHLLRCYVTLDDGWLLRLKRAFAASTHAFSVSNCTHDKYIYIYVCVCCGGAHVYVSADAYM